MALDSDGMRHELSGIGDRIQGKTPLVCRPLRPGETKYMHPDSENYGYIRVPGNLPAGKCVVTMSLTNDRDGRLPATERKVDVWKGKLAAPSLTLFVPKEDEANDPR